MEMRRSPMLFVEVRGLACDDAGFPVRCVGWRSGADRLPLQRVLHLLDQLLCLCFGSHDRPVVCLSNIHRASDCDLSQWYPRECRYL